MGFAVNVFFTVCLGLSSVCDIVFCDIPSSGVYVRKTASVEHARPNCTDYDSDKKHF